MRDEFEKRIAYLESQLSGAERYCKTMKDQIIKLEAGISPKNEHEMNITKMRFRGAADMPRPP